MKYLKSISLLLIALLLGISQSCEKVNEEAKSKIKFEVSIDEDQRKSTSVLPDDSIDINATWHLLVTAEDKNGQAILDDEIIPLLAFGDGFITGQVELRVGTYILTKFMVINPWGEVVYAAPVEGSPKAQLVDRPLPLEFSVSAGVVTRVRPQVIPVNDSQPADFGYVAFGFEVVRPIIAYVAAVDDNPLYLRPSMMIPAQLTIMSPDGHLWEYKLEAKINMILVKPGYDYYHVIVENPQYPPYEREIRAYELKNSSPENPVIFNLGEASYEVLEIQPGPENGKDAMITDLNANENFGDYQYFEASFLTEPVLTVMRTKWSLVHFDLSGLPKSARIKNVTLQLYFEQPLWDSLYNSELDDFMVWNDSLVFQQIIEPWEEHEVNWENQPQTIEANQVIVPYYSHLSSNMRTYNVTSLFVPKQEIAAPNHGFMFKHPDQSNPAPGGLQFASSDYPVKEMRPRLVVKYEVD